MKAVILFPALQAHGHCHVHETITKLKDQQFTLLSTKYMAILVP